MAVTSNQTAPLKPVVPEATKPAGIPAATDFATSGAPRQTTDIDVAHPAVDNDPRAGTSVMQNRADFNDPTAPGHDAVAESLNRQGVPTKSGAEAAASLKAAK